MVKCKHDFKPLAGGSGGWKHTEVVVQCKKCLKVFRYDTTYIERRLVEVEVIDK